MTTTKNLEDELINKRPKFKNGSPSRSEVSGENTARNQTSTLKESAAQTALAMIQLEALQVVSEYNRLKDDGTYFEIVKIALGANSSSNLYQLKQEIKQLQSAEGYETIDIPRC